MQKGSEVARTLHITLNCVNIALFAWQASVWHLGIDSDCPTCKASTCTFHIHIRGAPGSALQDSDIDVYVKSIFPVQIPTGLEIVGKVLQFTSFP